MGGLLGVLDYGTRWSGIRDRMLEKIDMVRRLKCVNIVCLLPV